MTGIFRTDLLLPVPIRRAWLAFTAPEYLATWLAPVRECDIRPGGRITFDLPGASGITWTVEAVEAPARLVWIEPPGSVPSERRTTVTLEPAGPDVTSVAIEEAGFGAGPVWQGHLDGTRLGWAQSLAGLQLYLRTGVTYDRMNTFRGAVGAHLSDGPAGPEVVEVAAGSYAEAAGLRPGDIILRLGAAPVFGLSDVWLFCREHAPGEHVEVVFARDGSVRSSAGPLGN
ncbi:SRPBCC domain-containing protein [Nonomuraea sp. NPDC050556]|uniref:SRPBCC domain-containing protein n=1 Tax=Nonomuraea sp. NPDC050556 TaxID=3364369 RepID=UPI0037900FFB